MGEVEEERHKGPQNRPQIAVFEAKRTMGALNSMDGVPARRRILLSAPERAGTYWDQFAPRTAASTPPSTGLLILLAA